MGSGAADEVHVRVRAVRGVVARNEVRAARVDDVEPTQVVEPDLEEVAEVEVVEVEVAGGRCLDGIASVDVTGLPDFGDVPPQTCQLTVAAAALQIVEKSRHVVSDGRVEIVSGTHTSRARGQGASGAAASRVKAPSALGPVDEVNRQQHLTGDRGGHIVADTRSEDDERTGGHSMLRLGGRDVELASKGVDRHVAIGFVTGEYAAGLEVEQDDREIAFMEERDLTMAVRSLVRLAAQLGRHGGEVEHVDRAGEPLDRSASQPACVIRHDISFRARDQLAGPSGSPERPMPVLDEHRQPACAALYSAG
jgi:hypothetical protein